MAGSNTFGPKRGGRPRVASDDQRSTIFRLYYQEEWTARRIGETLFPGLKFETIRKIAQQERRKAVLREL
jgi:hypothetical protein